MGDHQRGDPAFLHQALGHLKHLVRIGRVQGRGVLIEEEELGLGQCGHEHGHRLTLPTGEVCHPLIQPAFKAHVQMGQSLFQALPLGMRQGQAQSPGTLAQGQG